VISKETLDTLAAAGGLRPHQQEKHYVQNLALSYLALQPLVFKGGTYLWLFHGLNRFSEDLDFTATGAVPDDIDRIVSAGLAANGVENTVKRVESSGRSTAFRISAKGPLNTKPIDLCHVYVEISLREQVVMEPLPLKLDNIAYGIPLRVVRGMALEEVAAEKVHAILTRDKARDVFDLAFLAGKGVRFDPNLVARKMEYYKTPFSAESFAKAAKARKGAWKSEVGPLMLGIPLPDFDECLDAVLGWARA